MASRVVWCCVVVMLMGMPQRGHAACAWILWVTPAPAGYLGERTVFDYTDILAHWQDYPSVRIYYRYPDESGWARQVDDTHAALDNVPITGGLMRYDIVTFTHHEGDLPRLAHVIHHYYRWQWSVAYLAEGAATEPETVQAAYTTLRETCEAAGCAIEGAVPGLAIVNAPDDVDLRAVLAPLGLTGAALVLYQPAAPTRTEPGT